MAAGLLVAPAALGLADGASATRFAFAADGSWRSADVPRATSAAVMLEHDGIAARSSAAATPSVVATWPATQTIGRTARGRPMTLFRFGTASRRILIIGGIHGDEAGAPVARAFVEYLRTHRSAIPRGTQVDVLPVANPDGVAMGRRANARGVDLNRNFPSRTWRVISTPGRTSGRSAGSELETRAICRALVRGSYVRVVSLHSSGGMVDYAGPGGRAIAQRIARAADTRLARIGRPSQFPGSMGHYVPERFGIPIVTWELSSRTMTTRVRNGLVAALR